MLVSNELRDACANRPPGDAVYDPDPKLMVGGERLSNPSGGIGAGGWSSPENRVRRRGHTDRPQEIVLCLFSMGPLKNETSSNQTLNKVIQCNSLNESIAQIVRGGTRSVQYALLKILASQTFYCEFL